MTRDRVIEGRPPGRKGIAAVTAAPRTMVPRTKIRARGGSWPIPLRLAFPGLTQHNMGRGRHAVHARLLPPCIPWARVRSRAGRYSQVTLSNASQVTDSQVTDSQVTLSWPHDTEVATAMARMKRIPATSFLIRFPLP